MDAFVQESEDLFEKSYGHESGIGPEFKKTLKRDLFVLVRQPVDITLLGLI